MATLQCVKKLFPAVLLFAGTFMLTQPASANSMQWVAADSIASFNPGIRLQNVAYFSYNEDDSDFSAYHIGVRRFRPNARGFVVTPRLTYYLQVNFSSTSASITEAWLRLQDVDTVVVGGESTSGCVRASVVDAFSLGLQVVVVEEATFDRSPLAHKVNLFDMHHKYATVVSKG
jgi:hypothetical protein